MHEHSFIIPAYKDSPFLEECILSLKNQQYPSKITITTATPSAFIENITKKYDLPYFINEKPASIAGDWNFGLSKADAKFVTIAHQDDFYEKDFSAKTISVMQRDKNCLLAFTDYAETSGAAKFKFSINLIIKRILLFPFYIQGNIKNSFVRKSVLSIGNPICCPSVTINKMLLPEFKFSEDYSCALDWQAWQELAERKGSFVYIPEKLLLHRLHPESETTNQITNGRRLQEEKEILQRIWGKPIGGLISDIYRFAQKGNIQKL